MTRIGAWAAMLLLTGYGTLRGLEEAVRVYIERACR